MCILVVACSGANRNSQPPHGEPGADAETRTPPRRHVAELDWRGRKHERELHAFAGSLKVHYPDLDDGQRLELARLLSPKQPILPGADETPELAGVVESVSADGQHLSIRVTENPDAAPLSAAKALTILTGETYKGEVEVVDVDGQRLQCKAAFVRSGFEFAAGDLALSDRD